MASQTATFSLKIEKQEGGYLAYFPALPGCNTWGRRFEDAVRNAGEALIVYLETLRAHKEQLPSEHCNEPPISLSITVRLPD